MFHFSKLLTTAAIFGALTACSPSTPPTSKGNQMEEARQPKDTVSPASPAGTDTASVDNDLGGTSWQVEDVASGGIIDNANLTLVFGPDGRLSGSSGCNRFGAGYKINDTNGLSLSQIISTTKACVPALMNLEREFLGILGTIKTFAFIPEGGLTLTSEDGRTIKAMPISQ